MSFKSRISSYLLVTSSDTSISKKSDNPVQASASKKASGTTQG